MASSRRPLQPRHRPMQEWGAEVVVEEVAAAEWVAAAEAAVEAVPDRAVKIGDMT